MKPARIIIAIAAFVMALFMFPTPTLATEEVKNIPVCMNFGCKDKRYVTLEPKEWQSIADWFKQGPSSPENERQQIKQAIGWMEHVIGTHTPAHRDLGGDLSENAVFPGQLDCIDESINTTTYLNLFASRALLTHHIVI